MSSQAADRRIQPIKYETPGTLNRPKAIVNFAGSDILRVGVQVVQPHGGETNMHAHSGLDSTWFVLSGRARFYGYGDELVGEFGCHEGVFIPKGVPYWFEAAGEEPLEILHITARDRNLSNDRVDYAPPRERQAGMDLRGRPPTDEELRSAQEAPAAG